MKNCKRILNRFLFLPGWLSIILIAVSAGGLAFVFIKRLEKTPLAYGVYVVSFYTLCVVCAWAFFVLPGWYKRVKNKIYGNKYGNKYMTDPAYKINVNLYRSFCINLLYVVFNIYSAFRYSTAWFFIFAVYYSIMAVMRFLMLRYVTKVGIGKNRLGELKRAVLCSYILVTVNLSLAGAVLMVVNFGRGFSYDGILIYVVAMYTFYITASAIVGIVKYRKYDSPVMSMAKFVSLASALFSMLTLETAMFSQFGGDTSLEVQKIMIISTGVGIALIVVSNQ